MRYITIALLVFCMFAKDSSGKTFKETVQGESITFYVNNGGVEEKVAEISAEGTFKVDKVESLDGLGTPPGLVPLGSMIAIAPQVHANAWQPPATGAIKDGFMRADGATVSDPTSPMNGTVLPNMVDQFIRGATTSGGIGGSNSVTPSGIVSQPTLSGTPEARSTWFKDQAISAAALTHYHSKSTGSLSVNIEHSHASGVSATAYIDNSHADHLHTHAVTSPTGHSLGTVFGGGTTFCVFCLTPDRVNDTWTVGLPGTAGFETKHSTQSLATTNSFISSGYGDGHTLGAQYNNVTGSIGNLSGINGDTGTLGVTFDTANDNMEDWAATGDYTPTGTMTQPTFTGDSQTNMPVYNNVVWVIRVK